LSWTQNTHRLTSLERDLTRLKEKIQEAYHFVQLFPNTKIKEIILSAERQLNQAKNAIAAQQYLKARSHINIGFSILEKLYRELRNNPFIKVKFKERLDQIIREAEQIVLNSPNPEARTLLNRARYFRQKAFNMAGIGQSEAALKNYFLAIFFAENSIKSVQGKPNASIDNLERHFEDSKALMNQIKEMLGQKQDATINDILKRANEEFRQARRYYETRQNRKAYQQLQIVNRLLYRVLDLLEKDPHIKSERLLTEIELLEQSVAEFRNKIKQEKSDELMKLYERLSFLTRSIRQKYESGKIESAHKQLSVANRLLLQLQKRLDNKTNPVDVQIKNQLETAQYMLSTLEKETPNNPYYEPLLELLRKNWEKAKQAWKNNQTHLSIQHLKFFNNLSLKLDQMKTASEINIRQKQKILENFQRLEKLLNNPPNSLKDNEVFQSRYENAKRLYQIARSACQEENMTICWQITRMAIQLLIQ